MGFRFDTKEPNKLIPKAMYLFANGNDFFTSSLNLNKRFLSLTKQLAPSLDVFNKTSRKKTDADWINLQPQ